MKRFKIFDLGEKSQFRDRYTVVYLDEKEINGLYLGRSMCDNPCSPQGIGAGCLVSIGTHLGKRISFKKLPEKVKNLILNDIKGL